MYKKKSFDEINIHPKGKHCGGCPLAVEGASFAGTDGTGLNGVLLLGEALGETEAIKGMPFQGDAGYMLNQVLHRGGLKRKDFLIANTINCKPPNNALEGMPYEAAAIHHCSPYLDELLASRPDIKVVVPMGNVALHRMLGVKGVKNFHGTANFSKRYGVWVVPTLHPSYVLRTGGKELPTMVLDIKRALDIAQQGGWKQQPVDYSLYPTAAEFERWVLDYERTLAGDPTVWLSFDIETPYSQDIDEEEREDTDSSFDIIRVSFSYRSNSGITLPFTSDYVSWVRRLLASVGTKLGWNCNKFDVPRLATNGCPVGGQIIDGMDLWHFFYSDLPRGLGYASPFFTDIPAWKHLARVQGQEEYYSCVDADAALRIALGVKRELDKEGRFQRFVSDFVELEPVFTDLHEVGLGIDNDKREELKKYYQQLRDDADVLIQQAIPKDIKPLAKKDGYKGKPKEVREWLKQNGVGDATEEFAAWTACGYEQVEHRGADGDAETVVRWNKRLPFNVDSPQQIIKYIEWKYGSGAVPKHKKTGQPTTSAEELERLARQRADKVLGLIVDSGNAGTLLSNFLNSWETAKDGRVHTIYNNNPATFRLASKKPNAQNFPHRSEEAALLRQMVVPGTDWEYLVEADYSGIEAIMVGFYAKDDNYVRLAKMGVHGFLSTHMLADIGKFERLSLDMPLEDLKVALKAAKKIAKATLIPNGSENYYDGAKRTVHGTSYCMGPNLMHRNYPEVFPTAKDAEKLQDLFYSLFPSIKRWQTDVVDRAYWDCGVRNVFGYQRRLYKVKKYQFSQRLNDWVLVWDDDAKKAVATIPQGSAAAIIRKAMCSEAFKELREVKAALLQIHDSLVCRAKNQQMVEWVIGRLRAAMQYPIKEMNDLIIPIEVAVGKNWGIMETVFAG